MDVFSADGNLVQNSSDRINSENAKRKKPIKIKRTIKHSLKQNRTKNEEDDLDDDLEEESLQENHKSRAYFSEIVGKIMGNTLHSQIEQIIANINLLPDAAAVIIGGRSWNYFFKNKDLNTAEKIAVLPGNYDIIVFTKDESLFETQIYKNLRQWYVDVQKAVENMPIIHIQKKGNEWLKQFETEYHMGMMSIKSKRYYMFISSVSKALATKSLATKPKQKKSTQIQNKLLVYIEECLQPNLNFQRFKAEFLDTESHCYLNVVGLFTMHNIISKQGINKRNNEKKMNVDEIREMLFQTHYNTILFENLAVGSMENAVIRIVFEHCPFIFGADSDFYQSKLLFNFIEKYECCKVKYNNVYIPYSQFIKNIESDVLNANGGGKYSNLPSLRKIIQHFMTSLNVLSDQENFEEVGGDAFRHYLDQIKLTADIDSKCYYKRSSSVLPICYVFVFVMLITLYIQANDYFRIYREYMIKIGEHIFKMTIDNRKRNVISRVRFLPKNIFAVPLVSLDVKFNMYLEYYLVNPDVADQQYELLDTYADDSAAINNGQKGSGIFKKTRATKKRIVKGTATKVTKTMKTNNLKKTVAKKSAALRRKTNKTKKTLLLNALNPYANKRFISSAQNVRKTKKLKTGLKMKSKVLKFTHIFSPLDVSFKHVNPTEFPEKINNVFSVVNEKQFYNLTEYNGIYYSMPVTKFDDLDEEIKMNTTDPKIAETRKAVGKYEKDLDRSMQMDQMRAFHSQNPEKYDYYKMDKMYVAKLEQIYETNVKTYEIKQLEMLFQMFKIILDEMNDFLIEKRVAEKRAATKTNKQIFDDFVSFLGKSEALEKVLAGYGKIGYFGIIDRQKFAHYFVELFGGTSPTKLFKSVTTSFNSYFWTKVVDENSDSGSEGNIENTEEYWDEL